MSSYPYDEIVINGRTITIESILNGTAIAGSNFERTTLGFISDWMQEKQTFVQNTSGSTGSPKSILITRRQMIESAKMTIEALDLRHGYNVLLCISPDYIGGKMLIVRSFVAGMKIIACTPSSYPFSGLPSSQTIDFAAMVPYQIHEVLRSEDFDRFNEIKTVIIGGASIDPEIEKRLQAYRCTFYSTYGMTETVSHVALRQLNGGGASDYYRTLRGIRISSDERDCLVIEWNELPEKITTNDLVEIISSNTFRWKGRWDHIINSGGIKVIPEYVEVAVKRVFHELNIHNSFFVGGVADVKLGNKVTLFVEGYLSNELIEAIEQRMKRVVERVEVPKQIILIESFILTENGKINRSETSKPYMGHL